MTTIKIKGMSCQHCVASVTKALQTLPGVDNVQVDLHNGSATFTGTVEKPLVKQTIEKIGFEVVG